MIFKCIYLICNTHHVFICRSPISIRLPIGVASSKERLRLCQEFYSKSKQSREATCHGMIRHFLGFFPITWIKPIQRKLKCSGTLLNLPCTTEYFSMFSSPVEDVIVASTKENGKSKFNWNLTCTYVSIKALHYACIWKTLFYFQGSP